MQGEYYNEFPIVIKLKEEVEIKQLALGFHAIDTAFNNKIVGVPSTILLEGGLNLENMHSLGSLNLLDDEGYSNFSVKVFVKNFETI